MLHSRRCVLDDTSQALQLLQLQVSCVQVLPDPPVFDESLPDPLCAHDRDVRGLTPLVSDSQLIVLVQERVCREF